MAPPVRNIRVQPALCNRRHNQLSSAVPPPKVRAALTPGIFPSHRFQTLFCPRFEQLTGPPILASRAGLYPQLSGSTPGQETR